MPYTETAQEFFARIPALLAQAKAVSGDVSLPRPVRFDISGDDGGVFVVDFNAATVEHTASGPVGVILSAAERDFMALVEGRMSPEDGLLSGRLKIAGEAAALTTVMETIASFGEAARAA